MSSKIHFSKQPKLLRLHSSLRCFSTEISPIEPSLPSQSPPTTTETSTKTNSISITQQLLQLVQSKNDENWNKEEIFPLLSSIPISRLPQIFRRFDTSSKALKFYQWVCHNSPSFSISPSIAYQAFFELASRESDFHLKLSEILQISKTHNVSLTTDSVSILIRHFGRARMISESLGVFNDVDPSLKTTHLCNTLLDVLYRSGRVDDARVVLDEMFQPNSNFPPNDLTGSIVYSVLLKRNQIVNGEEMIGLVSKLGENEVFPDAVILSKLITNLCRDGNTEQAWDILHVLMKMNGSVEASSCNALLSWLGREYDFQKMNLLLSEMKEMGIEPNGITFGILLNHLCKLHNVDEALQVLDKMENENGSVTVVPDLISYNIVMKGLCKVGRQEEGLALVERMRSKHGYAPNTVTYNCLIDGFCKAGEIDRSRELFDQMKEEEVPADVITLNTLVDGMCKHGRISSALEFFNGMQKKGLKGNSITYNSLISAFCNVNNIDKAMSLFDEMLSSHCAPDSIVYYSLINGFSRAGRMDDACTVASKMKSAGFFLDAVSYNILISGFCKKKRLDKVYEILKEMEMTGVRPDEVTYNTLIASLSKFGDFSTVHRVMKQMTDQGLVPNVVTYGALINGYCKAGQLNEALKIFSLMGSTLKVAPNTVIYNNLIDSLCKEKKIEDAISLMDGMKIKEVLPNVTTFNAMFRGLREMNWLDKAFELMDKMNEQACNPDYVTMEILTEWLSAVGETDRLKKFVQGYQVSVSRM